MNGEIADQLAATAQDAAKLAEALDYYWNEEGVNQLGIFIDPDLYQYIERMYRESLEFAVRCQGLDTLAEQLRGA